MVVMAIPNVGNDDRRSRIGVRHQGFQAVFEDIDRIVTGPPRIERIDGLEPGVEVFAQCLLGCIADLGEWNPDVRCQIDQQFAFATRVVNAREPARSWPRRVRKEQQRGRELVERVDAHHPVAIEECAVGGVVPRKRTGVGAGHRGCVWRAAGLEDDHRNFAPSGLGECGLEALGIADRFDEEADDASRFAPESPFEIITRARDELAPARHAEVEFQTRIVEGQGAVDRSRLGNPGDRSDRRVGMARVGSDPQAALLVDESHAVSTADRDARLPGHRRDSLG